MTKLKYYNNPDNEMPVRFGDHKPTEKLAKELAGGVGWHHPQRWIPPTKTPITYPPKKNRPTKIPLVGSWAPFQKPKPYVYDYRDAYLNRFDRRQVSTDPCNRSTWKLRQPRGPVSIPDPEPADTLPGHIGINPMSFDEKPWLDSLPPHKAAKVGYTNFSNDLAADAPIKPGTSLADWDTESMRPKPPRPCTAEASVPPPPVPKDSVASLRGRFCRNCLERLHEDTAANVRYCSERCRNRSENTRRRGKAGTVKPGVELSSFAVDGKRIGIDTGDLGFAQLLPGVA
jgi:hypothetical protein